MQLRFRRSSDGLFCACRGGAAPVERRFIGATASRAAISGAPVRGAALRRATPQQLVDKRLLEQPA